MLNWRFLPHDWPGVLLHVVVAVPAVLAASLIGIWAGWSMAPVGALIANAVGWPVREAWQRHRKGKPIWPFSDQNNWEAWAPAASGAAVALIVIAAT